MRRPINDKALWFFGLAALACLGVSLPATAKAMELFHGSYGGIAATFVFEIGAVGAELATLAIPQWRKRLSLLTITLLILTTGGNYALGIDHFGTATDIGTTYATIRTAGAGWLLAIMSSAIFPALLFVFLTAFTARYRMVRGGYDTQAGALAFWMSGYWLTIGRELEQLKDWSREALQTKDAELMSVRNDLQRSATLLQQSAIETEQARNDHVIALQGQQQIAAELQQARAQRETVLQEHHQLKEWIRVTLQAKAVEINTLREMLQACNDELEIAQRLQLTDNADTLIVAGSAVGCNALARELKIQPSAISRAVKRLTMATENDVL